MPADSGVRRRAKRLLRPLLPESAYRYLHAASMARDIRAGQFDEPELDLVPLAVREGDTALDLGANYGLYSYHLSRVARAGKVYAFEPIPYTVATLRVVARLLRLRNVEIVPKGCSDRGGVISFRVPVQESGAVQAGQAHIGTRDDAREGSEEQVRWGDTTEVRSEVVAIDEFLPGVADLSFIKADIEGAELLAFRGAEQTIDRELPTVVCEINPWFLDGFALGIEDLTGFFADKGYSLYAYEREGGGRLRPIRSAGEIVEDNYVFIHPSRRERFASLFQDAEPLPPGGSPGS